MKTTHSIFKLLLKQKKTSFMQWILNVCSTNGKYIIFIIILNTSIDALAQTHNPDSNSHRTSETGVTKIYDINPAVDGDAIFKIVTIPPWLFTLHENGGTLDYGSILKMKTDGSNVTRWISWDSPTTDIEVSDTLLFGMKRLGGLNNNGLIFRTNIDGTAWTTIFNFPMAFAWPRYNFIVSGNTIFGSAFEALGGSGYIFSIDTSGGDFQTLTYLDGFPRISLIHEDYLYGIVWENAVNTIGRIKTDGSDFFIFESTNNTISIIMIDGLLYGITYGDGANNSGTLWRMNPDGNNYQKIHDFTTTEGQPDKIIHNGEFIYGISMGGGDYSMGSIFRFNKDGSAIQKLFDFSDQTNGYMPFDFIVSEETIFGLTIYGGAYGSGTIFKYFLGKPPLPPKEKIKTIALSIKKPETLQINLSQDMAVADGTYVNLDTTVTINGTVGFTYQWKVKGNGSLNEIDNIVKISHDSTFYLFATTTEGCTYSDSTTLRIKRITGIGDEVNQKNIVLFPNPNKGEFELRILNGLRLYNYEVLDVTGKVVYSDEFICPENDCTKFISLNSVKMGTYALILKQGSMILSRHKFIIIR